MFLLDIRRYETTIIRTGIEGPGAYDSIGERLFGCRLFISRNSTFEVWPIPVMVFYSRFQKPHQQHQHQACSIDRV
jgi:hypothetical protein